MIRRAAIVLVLSAAGVAWGPIAAPPALFPDRDFDAGIGRPASIAYSSDGQLLAVAGAQGLSLWNAQAATPIRSVAGARLTAVVFDRGSNLIAAGGADGRVQVIDLRTGASREVARHPKAVTAVAFQPDGRLGASGDTDGTVMLWDPAAAAVGTLRDASNRDPVLFLGFVPAQGLLSLTSEMNLITWDVGGQRPLRRSGLQSGVRGRTVAPTAASLDKSGAKLVVTAQVVAQQRGGALSGGSNLANPADLRRENVVLVYDVTTGISADPVVTGDFRGDAVALSPGGCFAFFASNYRSQPRVHVWGLIEQGADFVRQDLNRPAVAVAVDPDARTLAAATDAGRVFTYRVSGAMQADCDALARKPSQAAAASAAEAKISITSESTPLIQATKGLRIVVLRFEGASEEMGEGVAEVVADALLNTPGIAVIERAAIDKVLKEMKLQRSGLTDGDAVAIGKGLNARKIVLGSVRRFGDDTYNLTVRVVDVETQQVEGQRVVRCDRCREGDVLTAAQELRRLVAR